MEIAAAAYSFCDEEALDLVERLGPTFRHVRLNCRYPFFSASTVQRLLKLREEYGLTYHIHADYTETNLGALTEGIHRASINEAKRAVDYAASLGGGGVVTFHPAPWQYMAQWFSVEIKRLEIASFAEISTYALFQELTVAVENTPAGPDLLPVFPDSCDFTGILALLEAIPADNFGVTLDVGHAQQCGVDLTPVIPALGRRIKHVHFHDNDGIDDQHLPLGQGTINWATVVQQLVAASYDGVVELELVSVEDLLASKEYLLQRFGDVFS